MRDLVKGACGFFGGGRQVGVLGGVIVLKGCMFVLVSQRW